jgi:hypothetical protein
MGSQQQQHVEHGIVLPERTTAQAAEYFSAARKLLNLFDLIVVCVLHTDFVAYAAKKALEEDDRLAKKMERDEYDDNSDEKPEEKKLTPGELARTDPGPHTKALKGSSQELLELFLARFVDSFQTYIVSIIRAALRKQPKILSDSTYEMNVKSILDHDNIDSLVYDLVERKVSGLSYGGFDDLQNWCKKHGIPLTVPTGREDAVIELIATRNLIAHNGGVIDQKYFRIVKASRFKVGERRKLGPDDLTAAITLLGQIVAATDENVANSFGLEMLPTDRSRNQMSKD